MRESGNFVGGQLTVGENRTGMTMCFSEKVYNASKWTPDPIITTVPLLSAQIIFMAFLSGLVFLFLKPLNQSRLIAQIIGGIIIGPTFLGTSPWLTKVLFPFPSHYVLVYTQNIGTVYYMFQLGLEMNLTPMLKIGKRTTTMSITGMILPLAVGFGAYFLVTPPLEQGEPILPKLKSAFVWAIALTSTSLPDLTRVLVDLKLLRTDIGRIAVTSSFINDIATWFFLAVLVSITRPGYVQRMCISTVILILFCAFLARPLLSWVISRTSKGQDYKESHVQFILYGVLVWAFVTDALGLGSYVGAFLFGFSLPSGPLATLIAERIEKVALWITVPLYCIINGRKTSLHLMVPKGRSVKHVLLFMVVSWAAKVVSAFLVTFNSKKRTLQEVFTIGVLMNSKGVLALIIVNLGRELYLLELEAAIVMVATIMILMMSVPLVVKYTYKPKKRMMRHKKRTIMSARTEPIFRILTCIHTKHQVQGITGLLHMSNPTSLSKIYAIGVHLVELSDNAASAAMLIVHDTCRSKDRHQTNTKAELDPIVEAMEEFGEVNKQAVSVECLTAISRYATMHIDICSIAEDKHAALIIIPFHDKTARCEDDSEDIIDSHSVRNMNQQVLSHAPCTVGLLVDRGLGKRNIGPSHLLVFYIGGVDDREALSYAWRMVCRPNVYLTVVRFIQASTAVGPSPSDDPDGVEGFLNLLEDQLRQKELDDEFIDEFKLETMKNNLPVRFSDEVVNSGDETLAVMRDVMEANTYHLCIVGRGDRRISSVVSGLSDLIEFQELGAIGDALLTSNFSTSTSILVIQDYRITSRRGKSSM